MTQRRRILLIDDDPDFRTSVRSLLEAHGYEVVEAASGKQGLALLVEQRPDAVLLDIMLECCCEGYGINATIKYQDAYAEFRHTPILMVSSIEQSPDELYWRDSMVEMIRPDWYLTKPLDIPKLLALLDRELAASAAARS